MTSQSNDVTKSRFVKQWGVPWAIRASKHMHTHKQGVVSLLMSRAPSHEFKPQQQQLTFSNAFTRLRMTSLWLRSEQLSPGAGVALDDDDPFVPLPGAE